MRSGSFVGSRRLEVGPPGGCTTLDSRVKSIFLLEDDADLRETLELALKGLGVQQVLSVGSLRELQALGPKALGCACAVLDVNLGPRQPTGVDAGDWLRRCGFTGRIVFLTGHAGAYPLIQRASERLHSAILEKPASLGQLMAAIQPQTVDH